MRSPFGWIRAGPTRQTMGRRPHFVMSYLSIFPTIPIRANILFQELFGSNEYMND